MNKLIFTLCLLVALAFAIDSPIATFHNDECGDHWWSYSHYFSKGSYIEDSNSYDGDGTGFYVDFEKSAGTMELRVMDANNYNRMTDGYSYDWISIAPDSACDTMYYQFEEPAHYYVVAFCRSDEQCHAQLYVWDDSCTQRDKSSCSDAILCGWCEGISHIDGEDYCVPGDAFKAKYNIQCSDYSSYLGHIIIYSCVLVACCCLGCCVCCFMICRRPKARRPAKQQTTSLLIQQQPVMLPQQAQPVYNNYNMPQQQQQPNDIPYGVPIPQKV
eukprot:TRINITY_DN2583_c1_g1_i1.p1 TRINITY_DN2583_c1_g1~~TRINITY_DN2583_c1_g1_i1.p1  ORF type:complete len:272 (+),score=60.99 TRINITY_DN2583_c1_g1_i1:49-864(+)